MLGATVWFALVIGLAAAVFVDTAASLARAGLHAAADHALDPALNDALADYQNALQRAHATGAAPDALERTYASGSNGGDASPRLTLAYAVVPTTIGAPSCGGEPSAGADAVARLQCSAFVRESRMSLHLTVRVLDPAGSDVLAEREQYVTLRLFAEPPYSAVVGRRDGAALDPDAGGTAGATAHEGDVGPSSDALVHVRYECHDGAGRCAGAAPPDPDAELRSNVRWSNGNAVAP